VAFFSSSLIFKVPNQTLPTIDSCKLTGGIYLRVFISYQMGKNVLFSVPNFAFNGLLDKIMKNIR
jgi:hypothetical protein